MKWMKRVGCLALCAVFFLLTAGCSGVPATKLQVVSPWTDVSLTLPLGSFSAKKSGDGIWVRFKSGKSLEELMDLLAKPEALPPEVTAQIEGSGILFQVDLSGAGGPYDFFYLKVTAGKNGRGTQCFLTAMCGAIQGENGDSARLLLPLHLLRSTEDRAMEDPLPLDTPLPLRGNLLLLQSFYEKAGLYNVHLVGDELVLNNYTDLIMDTYGESLPLMPGRVRLYVQGSGDGSQLVITMNEDRLKRPLATTAAP
ncbi:MAG: hypothetical protein LBJ11_05820 [Oscillospiraceae bacterium]|jgi:hypothetical protein|nr:hypothetical protein [Oscillospiraceae bacterium]